MPEKKAEVFSRVFNCDGKICNINIFVPEPNPDGDYICSYEITISDKTVSRTCYGIDAIQAFLLALMQMGSFLYSGKLIDPAKAFWLSPEDMGYLGLPIPIEDQADVPSGPKLRLVM